MAEFWNNQDLKRPTLAPGENRYHVYFDKMTRTWNIFDMMQVPEDTYQDPPEDSYIAIPQKIVRALLEELADTELIDYVLADKNYQKDVEERHLDIIEKLIDQDGQTG